MFLAVMVGLTPGPGCKVLQGLRTLRSVTVIQGAQAMSATLSVALGSLHF